MTSGWRTERPTSPMDPWNPLATDDPHLPPGVLLAADGGVSLAGLEWLGHRVYDPATRGFLSTDPLESVVGSGWSGNPYSYAGNDPMPALDPLGLRPVSDAELRAYRDGNNGAFSGAATFAAEMFRVEWENKELILAGLAVVGGIALMCTGVGGPVGLALLAGAGALVSGGISVASQKIEDGSVDWGRVGIDAAVGAVSGAAGAGVGAAFAKRGSTIMARTVGAAASGAAEGAVDRVGAYVAEPGPHTPEGLLAAGAENALIGAATARITAKMPPWLSVKEMKCFDNWVYRSRYTTEPTVMFRAGDINGFHAGEWWSTDAPLSVSRVRSEKALPPQWPNGDASHVNTGFASELPAGWPAYSGTVAPQRGPAGELYPGGTNQTYMPMVWNDVKEMQSWPLVP